MNSNYYQALKEYYFRLKDIGNLYPYYSLKMVLKLFCYWLACFRLDFVKAQNRYVEKKNKFILKWMEQEYGFLIPGTLSYGDDLVLADSPYIFVCWWQAIDKMPDVPRLCVESIKRNAGNHEVILLDKHNVQDYIDIPVQALEMLDKNVLKLAHLSDFIRLSLLYKYGGIWLDATVLLTDEIKLVSPSNMFASIRIKPLKIKTISDYRWTTYCIVACRNSPVIKVFLDVFKCNFEQGRFRFVDYLFIDFAICLLYQKCPQFKGIIDNTPYSNPRLYELVGYLNSPVDSVNLEEWSDTSLYKLNWRVKVKCDNSYETVFQKLEELYGKVDG